MKCYTRRNSLRLQGYDYSRPGICFLTICVKDGEMMLGEIKDSRMIPSDYGKIVQAILEQANNYNTKLMIESYVIMPNHVHLLVRVVEHEREQNLCSAVIPSFVRTFKTLASKQIGFSLWQRSYFDNIVHSKEEFEIIRNYIENNPATWEKDKFYCAHNL